MFDPDQRSAIHEILVRSIADANELEITIHWHGGVHTRVTIDRPIRRRGNKAPESLVDMVTQLAESLVDPEIARILNLENIETPRGLRWTQDRVRDFRHQHHILSAKNPPSDNVLNFNQIKAHLQLSNNALLALVRRGAIVTNQVTEFAPWRVPREQLDSDQVKGLVRYLKTTGRLPKQRGCPDRQRQLFDATTRLRSEL